MKRTNPYTTLKNYFSEYVTSVIERPRICMWRYPIEELSDAWSLRDLYQRVDTARHLGYEVHLRADVDGLHVEYVPEVDGRPYNI
jgi:hypothetical protein